MPMSTGAGLQPLKASNSPVRWNSAKLRAFKRLGCPTASVAPKASPPSRTRQSDPKQLRDPAKIGGKATNSINVQDLGGAVSLDDYMRLPVREYSQLEPGMITALGGNSFLLRLPRIEVLGVWVAPEVEVEVTQQHSPPRVVLEARSCHLPGSPFFKTLEGKFSLHFRTELAWRGADALNSTLNNPAGRPAPAVAAAMHMQPPQQQLLLHRQRPPLQQQHVPVATSGFFPGYSGTGPRGMATGPGMSGAAAGLEAAMPAALGRLSKARHSAATAAPVLQRGEITGNLAVEVWAETLPPFHLLPRPVLEGSCNTVLSALISAMLPLFMRRLGEDYERWAADAEYRASRAQAAGSGAQHPAR